ncbi:MAG: class E sortase [Nocardioidaceae bacterium]
MLVPEAPPKSRSWRLTLIVGLVCVAVGVGLLGYVGWEYIGTNIVSKHRQAEITKGLKAQWKSEGVKGSPAGEGVKDSPAGEGVKGSPAGEGVKDSVDDEQVERGEGMALLHIQRFGTDYEIPIVKGVDDDSLASGVGWFAKSAPPGKKGNFAVAGHRVTHGEPFADFPELRVGDEVVVETRSHIYTYGLRDNGTDRILDFGQTWVLDPVPGEPEAKPTEAMITLVTCSELFHTDNRSVVFGDLLRKERRIG